MKELGFEIGNTTIARHYQDVIDALLIHQDDPIPDDVRSARADIMMRDDADRTRVAREVLALAVEVAG